MKIELQDCPKCGFLTLMVKVKMQYVQQGGAHEEFDAWYCTNCGKKYSVKSTQKLTEVVGGII